MKKIHSSDLIAEVQPSYKRICKYVPVSCLVALAKRNSIKREEIEYNARSV
jgi:hypothetical protein